MGLLDVGLPIAFHVQITRKKGQGASVYAFDLDRDELQRRVVRPYSKDGPIDIAGALISPDEREQVTILGTAMVLDPMWKSIEASLPPTIQYPRGPAGKWHRLVDSEIADDVTTMVLRRESSEVRDAGRASGVVQPAAEPPKDPRRVLVVYGRNERMREGLFAFLRALKLDPIEWEEALLETGKCSPYIGEVVDQLFATAQAVVVQMTPDEDTRLVPELVDGDDVEEGRQPRPNVLFEAGMAWAMARERTIFLEYGKLRRPSDISGVHVVRMDGRAATRKDLAARLQKAGCPVSTDGEDWLKVSPMRLTTRQPRKPKAAAKGTVARDYAKDVVLRFVRRDGEDTVAHLCRRPSLTRLVPPDAIREALADLVKESRIEASGDIAAPRTRVKAVRTP